MSSSSSAHILIWLRLDLLLYMISWLDLGVKFGFVGVTSIELEFVMGVVYLDLLADF